MHSTHDAIHSPPKLDLLFQTCRNPTRGGSHSLNSKLYLSTYLVGEEVNNEKAGKKKRKVALVCCFVGSKYYGLQMDANSPYETVELKLSQH